jgi:hypothetical protein
MGGRTAAELVVREGMEGLFSDILVAGPARCVRPGLDEVGARVYRGADGVLSDCMYRAHAEVPEAVEERMGGLGESAAMEMLEGEIAVPAPRVAAGVTRGRVAERKG